MARPLGLLLLLWMGLAANGEDMMSHFIGDMIDTYHLLRPTIVYDRNEETPDICYTRQWVLCLPSEHSLLKSDGLATEPETKSKESETEQVTHFKDQEQKLEIKDLDPDNLLNPMNIAAIYNHMVATLLAPDNRGERLYIKMVIGSIFKA